MVIQLGADTYDPTTADTIRPILVCIVKNEIRTLPRLFASLRGKVEAAVIVDTGSDDGTQDWCINHGSRILDAHVALRRRRWVDFPSNRNQAMHLAWNAWGDDKWLLLADADWEFRGEFPKVPISCNPDLPLGYTSLITGHAAEITHTTLVKGRAWHWDGSPVHEYLMCDRTASVMPADYTFHHHADGGSRGRDDITTLTEYLKDHPDDPRATFYLGQTYFDRGEYEEALMWYEKRASMTGTWEEERWYARFMVGRCFQEMRVYDTAMMQLMTAIEQRRDRPEPYYFLSGLFRTLQLYWMAQSVCVLWLSGNHVIPLGDVLFVHTWIAEYGIKFESSICTFYLKGNDAGVQHSRELLRKYGTTMLPSVREALERNISNATAVAE